MSDSTSAISGEAAARRAAPTRPGIPQLRSLRRAAGRYPFALAAAAAVAIGVGAMWAAGALTHGGHHGATAVVPLRTSAAVGDMSVAVMEVQRLRDAHAGVNSPKLPMSGPAMPSSTMGPIGGSLTAKQEQIAVTLTLRNPSEHPVRYDAGRLLLVKDGREVPLLKRTRSTLGEGTLMPGSQISGGIYYVVRRGTAPLQLRDVGSRTVFAIDRPGSAPQAAGGAADDDHGH